MDKTLYELENHVKQSHWWFVGRRRLFSKLIHSLKLDYACPILDVGCSTGTNLRMLTNSGFLNVIGFDRNPLTLNYVAAEDCASLVIGDVCELPFDDNSFSLILATDIIEHVDDDKKAVEEMFRVLRTGGFMLISVPTFQSLWGPQDNLSHHKRRYRLAELLAILNRDDSEILSSFYFNFLLFIPILIVRKFLNLMPMNFRSENEINTVFVNKLLTKIFYLDVDLAPFLPIPFGVSALVLLRKKNS